MVVATHEKLKQLYIFAYYTAIRLAISTGLSVTIDEISP